MTKLLQIFWAFVVLSVAGSCSDKNSDQNERKNLLLTVTLFDHGIIGDSVRDTPGHHMGTIVTGFYKIYGIMFRKIHVTMLGDKKEQVVLILPMYWQRGAPVEFVISGTEGFLVDVLVVDEHRKEIQKKSTLSMSPEVQRLRFDAPK